MTATIIEPLKSIAGPEVGVAISYLQGAIDAAAKRIDAGNDAALEIRHAQLFAVAGLRALATH
jgi:hypothetical protein